MRLIKAGTGATAEKEIRDAEDPVLAQAPMIEEDITRVEIIAGDGGILAAQAEIRKGTKDAVGRRENDLLKDQNLCA